MIFDVVYNTEPAANKAIAQLKTRPRLKPKMKLQRMNPRPIRKPILRNPPMKEKSFFEMNTVEVNPMTSKAVM